jgi:hypothetical protein
MGALLRPHVSMCEACLQWGASSYIACGSGHRWSCPEIWGDFVARVCTCLCSGNMTQFGVTDRVRLASCSTPQDELG